jgi:hypothetical protein
VTKVESPRVKTTAPFAPQLAALGGMATASFSQVEGTPMGRAPSVTGVVSPQPKGIVSADPRSSTDTGSTPHRTEEPATATTAAANQIDRGTLRAPPGMAALTGIFVIATSLID